MLVILSLMSLELARLLELLNLFILVQVRRHDSRISHLISIVLFNLLLSIIPTMVSIFSWSHIIPIISHLNIILSHLPSRPFIISQIIVHIIWLLVWTTLSCLVLIDLMQITFESWVRLICIVWRSNSFSIIIRLDFTSSFFGGFMEFIDSLTLAFTLALTTLLSSLLIKTCLFHFFRRLLELSLFLFFFGIILFGLT